MPQLFHLALMPFDTTIYRLWLPQKHLLSEGQNLDALALGSSLTWELFLWLVTGPDHTNMTFELQLRDGIHRKPNPTTELLDRLFIGSL